MNKRKLKKIKDYSFIIYGFLALYIVFIGGCIVGAASAKENTKNIVATVKSADVVKTAEIVAKTSEKETRVKHTEKATKAKTTPFLCEITAYCPCNECCGKNDGITATGVKAIAGRTIAVDPSVIPYGTKVKINGHTYVAEDCGGAIKDNRIDIFFDTHEEALKFGRQTLTAYIIN